jgi:hypothetical protein
MATRTRTGRTPTTGRFARSASTRSARTATTGRFARSTSTPRRRVPVQGLRRRRQSQPTGLKKVMSALVPTTAAKKATPSSKKGKAGGLALVAAAAGMAFKNRGKISEMRGKQSDGGTPSGTSNASSPPTTPAV